MKLVKASDHEVPICPHSEKQLHEVKTQDINKGIGVSEKFVYFCPYCQKVLGFSHAAYT
jgi:hypothetical protein